MDIKMFGYYRHPITKTEYKRLCKPPFLVP
jgi:hypothetical protein